MAVVFDPIFFTVKSVQNFWYFFCKSWECCNFGVLLSFFGHFITIYVALCYFLALYGAFGHFWPVTLFCEEFTFVAIYRIFWVKLF